MIEDSFYRPRRGDIIIEEAQRPEDYDDGGNYYQKAPKSQVSVASSHGRPNGPEYPRKTRPVLLGMFILKTKTGNKIIVTLVSILFSR